MNRLKKILSSCIAEDNQIIKRKILKYDIISFDIYDTLIKRDIQNRELFFSLISEEASRLIGCDETEFPQMRIEAEKKVLSEVSGNNEVSIYDIYSQFGLESPNSIKKLIALEEESEFGVSSINPAGKDLYDFACRKNKIVILVSDMYLSRKSIEEILKKNGIINYEYLFLSSEINLTKRSGALFRYIDDTFSFSKETILHIGNDLKADYTQAKRYHFPSCLFDQYSMETEFVSPGNKYFKKGILYDFISNHINPSFSDFEKLGYEVLGPLLVGYCQWLNRSRNPNSIVLFLAREGALLKEAYQILFPKEQDNCKYAYVSRRALIGVELASVESVSELNRIMKPLVETNLKLSDLVRFSFITKETLYENSQLSSLDLDIVLNDDLERDHQKLCERLLCCIRKENIDSARCFQLYWAEIALGSKRMSIADVGWRGSMQDILQNLLPEYYFDGYYYGVESINKTEDKHGFLYSEYNSSVRNDLVFSRQLFELLFLNPSGSVIAYSSDSEKVKPIFDAVEYGQTQVKQISAMQKAAILFVRDYESSWIGSKKIILDKTEVYGCYDSLINDNFNKLFNLFGSYKANDGGLWSLFPSDGWTHWLLHPGQLFKEFSHSYCKSLYLRKLFRIPLPYSQILGYFKQITGNHKGGNK